MSEEFSAFIFRLSSTLRINAPTSSKTRMYTSVKWKCQISGDNIIHNQCHQNLKSHKLILYNQLHLSKQYNWYSNFWPQNKDQSQDIDYTCLTWYCVTLSWFQKNYTGQGPFLKDLKSTINAAVTGPQKITSSRFWNVCTKSQSNYSEDARIKIP
jgi:hypothetical protein